MALRIRGKRLVIDFRCDLPGGRRVRCVESEGENTKRNRARAEAKWKAVDYALRFGRFDYLKFFPYGSKAKYFTTAPVEILFSEFWDRWLDEQAVKPATMTKLRSVYRAHLKGRFGKLFLHHITDHEIKVFRRHLLEVAGLQERTVNGFVKILCRCLRKAQRDGLISDDPCLDIRKLKENKTKIEPFNFNDLRLLINTAKKHMPEYADLILIWSRTGLRNGEILGLKWGDVDYVHKTINIRSTLLKTGKEGVPKTVGSQRHIEIRPPVLEAFKRQEARTGLQGSYVFLNHRCGPIKESFWQRKWAHLLRLAGLAYRAPKQMRHTFATLHLASGESPSWVAKMLGHSSDKITYDYYNAFVPNLTRDDGSAFERIMNGQIGNNLVTTPSKSLK